MGLGISTRTKRDDYVRLGSDVRSISISSLPIRQRELIKDDPVLKTLVRDQVIRGEDFGKFYDRLHELDVKSGSVNAGQPATTGKADAMYTYVKGSLDAQPTAPTNPSLNPRTRMGIFTPIVMTPKVALDDVAGGSEAADQKYRAASDSAQAGDLYSKQGDELAAKGDQEGAKTAYKKAGDAYADAVKNQNIKPNLSEHWSANDVADWGLKGIEAYQKGGLDIQKQGTARSIGKMDVDKVENGVKASNGFDMGLDRGDRFMRLGDALAKSGDKAGALEQYQSAKSNYADAVAEDKKFFHQGLEKHTRPLEKADYKIAVTQAAIDRDGGTKFTSTDYRDHLLKAESLSGMQKADELSRALQSRKPPMPEGLRAQVGREACEAVHEEMKSVEKNGTLAEKGLYGETAADYFQAFGNTEYAKEAYAMAAKANLALGPQETDPLGKAELYAMAARQMELAGTFTSKDIESAHEKAATAYVSAAQRTKTSADKGELLEKAGGEYRGAKKEALAQNAFREGAKNYLAAAKQNPSILTAKPSPAVTVADLGGMPSVGEIRANNIGKAAALFEKSGSTEDQAAAAVLRNRSEAMHNLALREKFKDPQFVPPIALDNGEITPKSINDYEMAIVAKNQGDFEKAAAEFEMLRDTQSTPIATYGSQYGYFEDAAQRMNSLQTMQDAGVKNLSQPPTRKNFADYAKARADFYRGQKDKDGLSPTEPQVARRVAEDLADVADPFYAHREQVGKDIDYGPGKNNTPTVGLTGRSHGDCEVYAYDVALAMEAAGFKCSTETRDPLAGGESHVVVNLQDKDGNRCGSMSNNGYYGNADSAFKDVGLPPGSTKTPMILDRDKDPKAPKI